MIERVIVIGWSARKGVLQAQDSKGRALDVEWGPLHLKAGLPDVALHVRKPNLSITEDWNIQILNA